MTNMSYKPELSCFIRRAQSLIPPGQRVEFIIGKVSRGIPRPGGGALVISSKEVSMSGYFSGWDTSQHLLSRNISLRKTINGIVVIMSQDWAEISYNLPDYWAEPCHTNLS